jgi:DNA-binding transcriptional regulator/RsmH inhibitor MraZ
MTSIVGEGEVLKIDERGRVRVPVERREALLDEFEKSGMSGAKFARLAGIKYATFANWTHARRKARSQESPGSEPLRLIEAVMEGSGNGSCGLVIELPGGGRVRVESPLQLRLAAELLSMMAQSSARGRC